MTSCIAVTLILKNVLPIHLTIFVYVNSSFVIQNTNLLISDENFIFFITLKWNVC